VIQEETAAARGGKFVCGELGKMVRSRIGGAEFGVDRYRHFSL
jgi:hypothetical protein